MNSDKQKSASELIADLCDGLLRPEDKARLTRLLRDDPFFQNEYLDQAMIDGMLRYEFGFDRLTVPYQFVDTANHTPLKLIVGAFVVSLLAFIFAGEYLWLKQDTPLDISIPLANLSFESDLPISTKPMLDGWYGDEAQIVTGSDDHLAPHGIRMLQLVRSVHQPSNECEVYHVIDLSSVSNKSGPRPLFIEAKMVANARSNRGEASFVISLELYTYSELPELERILVPSQLSNHVMVSGNKVAADSDPKSWQELRLLMPLAKDAKYGIIKISARDSSLMADDEYKEVFIDHVQVRMTNEGLL